MDVSNKTLLTKNRQWDGVTGCSFDDLCSIIFSFYGVWPPPCRGLETESQACGKVWMCGRAWCIQEVENNLMRQEQMVLIWGMGIEELGNAENGTGAQAIFTCLLSKSLPCGQSFAGLWEPPVEGMRTRPCLWKRWQFGRERERHGEKWCKRRNGQRVETLSS